MPDPLIEGLKKYTVEQHDPWGILAEFSMGEQIIVEDYAECVCGKEHIKRITYVIHKKTLQQLIIGSQCIGRFGLTGICNRCHKNTVEKSTYNMCKACRRTGKKSWGSRKVKKGKYQGVTYSWVYEEKEDYCNWVLETPSFPDKDFRQYLLHSYEVVEGKSYFLAK